MPYGAGMILRTAMGRAKKPWQRVAICVVMIAAGVVLVVVGHVTGALLAVAGVGMLVRLGRAAGTTRRSSTPPVGPDPSAQRAAP